MKIEDFDRIHSLGFWIVIDWNICFSIDYLPPDEESINILVCSYEEWSPNIKFDDVIELSCDIFYEWYNDNKNKIDNLSQNDFDDIVLGNITKRVRRNLNLDKLL
jgi:hypothetical protein